MGKFLDLFISTIVAFSSPERFDFLFAPPQHEENLYDRSILHDRLIQDLSVTGVGYKWDSRNRLSAQRE